MRIIISRLKPPPSSLTALSFVLLPRATGRPEKPVLHPSLLAEELKGHLAALGMGLELRHLVLPSFVIWPLRLPCPGFQNVCFLTQLVIAQLLPFLGDLIPSESKYLRGLHRRLSLPSAGEKRGLPGHTLGSCVFHSVLSP